MMRSRLVLVPAVSCVMLCSGASLGAQGRGYHMELWAGRHGQVVVLFNESRKAIEAYHFAATCGSSSTETSYDSLTGPGSTAGSAGVDGKEIIQDTVLKPEDRMVTTLTLLPQPSGCTWRADIDAVLYADGSYEGDEGSARGLAAHRDGLAAGVRYWAKWFGPESATGGTTLTEAERLGQRDREAIRGVCSKSIVVCSYWRGRSLVDGDVALWAKPQGSDATETYRRTMNIFGEWRKKVERDAALKQTDAAFPLPAELQELDRQAVSEESAAAP